jgi:hypothetical protein
LVEVQEIRAVRPAAISDLEAERVTEGAGVDCVQANVDPITATTIDT